MRVHRNTESDDLQLGEKSHIPRQRVIHIYIILLYASVRDNITRVICKFVQGRSKVSVSKNGRRTYYVLGTII